MKRRRSFFGKAFIVLKVDRSVKVKASLSNVDFRVAFMKCLQRLQCLGRSEEVRFMLGNNILHYMGNRGSDYEKEEHSRPAIIFHTKHSPETDFGL